MQYSFQAFILSMMLSPDRPRTEIREIFFLLCFQCKVQIILNCALSRPGKCSNIFEGAKFQRHKINESNPSTLRYNFHSLKFCLQSLSFIFIRFILHFLAAQSRLWERKRKFVDTSPCREDVFEVTSASMLIGKKNCKGGQELRQLKKRKYSFLSTHAQRLQNWLRFVFVVCHMPARSLSRNEIDMLSPCDRCKLWLTVVNASKIVV